MVFVWVVQKSIMAPCVLMTAPMSKARASDDEQVGSGYEGDWTSWGSWMYKGGKGAERSGTGVACVQRAGRRRLR